MTQDASNPSSDTPGRRWRARWWVTGLAAAVASFGPSATVLEAQTLSDLLVPRGRVRLDFTPSVRAWDTRYGLGPDGAVEERLGSDLTDPRGVSLFPGIPALEETLRTLSGDGSFQGVVGSSVGRLSNEVTRLDVGLRLGVFDWLTVGANVPYVRGRSTLDLSFTPDAAANLGITPGGTNAGDVSHLLTALGESAVAAQNRARTLCAGGGSAGCPGASALAQRATAFWEGLAGAYFATPFFPLASSQVAGRLRAALNALDADLAQAGLPTVGVPLLFASTPLDEAAFLGLASNPAAGIQGRPLRSDEGLWRVGDVELSAALRLLEGEVRDPEAVSPRFSYRVGGGFLLRLPTGLLDDPDAFLDLASGDGQLDMEGRLDVALRLGGRLGLAGSYRYGTQQSVDIVRRVAPYQTLLPPASSRRAVRWTPGAYSFVEISPRLYLGEAVALAADFRRFQKDEDDFQLLGDGGAGLDGVDVGVLSRGTEVQLSELALGLRYSSLGLFRQGRVGTPAEVGLRYVRPLSGSGGRTPKATTLEFSVSLFRRIWG